MFDASQQSTGTGYTTTVALLVVAFVFSPAVILVSRPVGYPYVLAAIACSVLSIALAWINWKKYSRRSIPSIATVRGTAK